MVFRAQGPWKLLASTAGNYWKRLGRQYRSGSKAATSTPGSRGGLAERVAGYTKGRAEQGWRAVLGDRTGATIFIAALLVFALTWRIGPFINDNYTVANTLVAVADGHLNIETPVYGPSALSGSRPAPTPGTHEVEGEVFGRNYGHVFLSLPFLWVLSAVASVSDVGIALAATWSGLLFVLVVAVTSRFDRRREGMVGGAALATVTLGANLAVVRQIASRWHPWIALQLSTMVAAALVAVLVYRTVARMDGERLGTVAGIATAVATPVGFWATIPKRHSLSALFAVATLYCFYRSRAASTDVERARFRALAYVPGALASWVHAPEGFVLLIALGAVDVLTAKSNGHRRLVVVAIVVVLAMLPVMVTNSAVVGTPFEPPRVWPEYDPGTPGGETGGPGGSGESAFGSMVGVLVLFLTYMTQAALALIDPARLFSTFVRSGNELGLGQAIIGARSLNISVLESMPLAGLFLILPLEAYRRVRARGFPDIRTVKHLDRNPDRAADLLMVAYLSLLIVMYQPRLPIRVSFTVRYLHPLYPLLVYGLARLEPIRRVIDTEWRLLGVSFAGFVVVGGPLLFGMLAAVAGRLEIAVQYHARLALAAAAMLVYWGFVKQGSEGYERGGAVLLAFAAGVSTLYLLLSAWGYFPYSEQFAIPAVRVVSDLVAIR